MNVAKLLNRSVLSSNWSRHYHVTDKLRISISCSYIGFARANIGYKERTMSGNSGAMKPPNIAVYADEEQFAHLKAVLGKCVDVDCYTFVRLNDRKVYSDPWRTNVQLLVVARDNVPPKTEKIFVEYWQKGGKLLDVCSDFIRALFPVSDRETANCKDVVEAIDVLTQSRISVELPRSPFLIRDGSIENVKSIALTHEGNTVLVGVLSTDDDDIKGAAVFSQARLNEDELPFWRRLLSGHLGLVCAQNAITDLTPCHLFTSSKRRLKQFLARVDAHTGGSNAIRCSNVTLGLVKAGETVPTVTPTHIPLVLAEGHGPTATAPLASYFTHLKTHNLGKVVFFGHVLPSTMDLINSHVVPHGVAVIASRQTHGKGRRDNSWLSPEGCATFSVNLQLPVRSKLGQKLPFIQHLAAMAMVDGIRTLPGHQKLNLRLKWPNDVYYGDTVKVGGLIVQSSVLNDTVHCIVGCGLNISNGNPTACVNDVIRKECPSLAPLTPEVSIACTLSKLEELIATFQSYGAEAILPRYYELWLHQKAEVTCTLRGQVQSAVVQGLDSYGFLNLYLKNDGRTFSVQPDGNSFDMMHNLIIVRDSA